MLSPQASSHLGGANKKPELLYDGQHFDHWQAILKTDLSLEKRIEAVRAMGAFGANGYGPEAARAVLAVMRGYSIMEIDGSLEGTFKQAAFAAVTKLPRGEAFKPLAKTLENGNANQRVFSASVLASDAVNSKDALPLLAKATNDEDLFVRFVARRGVALLDHDLTTLMPILRASLASHESRDVIAAAHIISGQPIVLPTSARVTGSRRQQVVTVLIPDLVNLLGHADEKVRRSAAEGLHRVGSAAEGSLKEAIASKDAKLADRAQKLLDAIEHSRQLPASAYSECAGCTRIHRNAGHSARPLAARHPLAGRDLAS